MTESFHPAHPLPPDIRSKHRSKTVPPQPHGLVAGVNPALGQHILNAPKAERKADIHYHDQADDLR